MVGTCGTQVLFKFGPEVGGAVAPGDGVLQEGIAGLPCEGMMDPPRGQVDSGPTVARIGPDVNVYSRGGGDPGLCDRKSYFDSEAIDGDLMKDVGWRTTIDDSKWPPPCLAGEA